MSEPTDATTSWMNPWAASVPPFMKAMFPATQDALSNEDGKSPVEEQFAALHATWKESIQKWAALAKEGTRPDALTPEALLSLFSPARWSGPGSDAFDSGLRDVLEGPKYATLWNMDRELLQLQQRATERDKQVRVYQAIVQKAWNKAFERFTASFAGKGEVPSTWRGLTDRWLAIANETLIEAHRSDEFVQAQSRMLRAASDYRLQERHLAEAWCAASHIPTRTEMDEMQRVVTQLRREQRLQRRQLAASATSTLAAKPQAPATKRATLSAKAPTLAAKSPTPRTVGKPAPKRRTAAVKKTRRTAKA
ncbi:poly(R)-hydroxyalkanoic acid synthase subunit PhaE [Variovorax sp. J22R133]|uniref:poly(R)-hydroxyalkanoic acid synthase subunit PhaE n=1 Tax=Variovorax brevis TaxID=3053503 RepID=UPI0025767D38|nr:poly(R)-hydroxyalkanoic acid synthase subunit PhaE [Variovorax sp. J22R133]MDM0111995.1 poly(R)-hydroxyalkanoic acid synthase subunit PhaE [Variovorax sp. J22R133]